MSINSIQKLIDFNKALEQANDTGQYLVVRTNNGQKASITTGLNTDCSMGVVKKSKE